MDTDIYSYDDQIQKIDQIKFNVWPNPEILRGSALGKDTDGVTAADLYDNQEPKRGGLIDSRMGTTNESRDCDTCGLNYIYCVGHFGHLTLADYVFHTGYLQFVKKILSCICIRCSKLLIYKNENEIMEMLKNTTGRARLSAVRNLVKNVTYCQKANYGCGAPVSKIRLEIKKSSGAITLYSETNLANLPKEEGGGNEGRKKNRQILTPSLVYDILKEVSDQDCIIMGMDPKDSRPEEMIHKIFPIPPVAVRPSVRAEFMASSLMEDDLTHKLADIIKANDRIAHHSESESASKFSQDHLHLLQYQVASYVDGDMNIPKSEQKGKITKSLAPRLKGKEGRVKLLLWI
ncbi:MAG: DNA-directed RNA polymerase subunit alpha [Terrestrivirus sp.]|uniref:DNA-directed RNA polymerase n=1 Tax=Terrestrivirus sp. TaxID=2487775 RepID=A0A3G4ZMT1_9VIRU|nr:MAG: DNA-directed RNA polymerase subunit alpha [Terrestrivirus sp.]